jgi:hypothetical protein
LGAGLPASGEIAITNFRHATGHRPAFNPLLRRRPECPVVFTSCCSMIINGNGGNGHETKLENPGLFVERKNNLHDNFFL